eukprot:517813-Pelagomonas_calceolata.AAC.1
MNKKARERVPKGWDGFLFFNPTPNSGLVSGRVESACVPALSEHHVLNRTVCQPPIRAAIRLIAQPYQEQQLE